MIALIRGTEEDLKHGRGEIVLTAAQAARLLGVSRRRIAQLVTEGRLTPLGETFMGSALFTLETVHRLRDLRLPLPTPGTASVAIDE